MIAIRTDAEGNILAWGDPNEVRNGTNYSGTLPDDFTATASLGKYQFDGEAIHEVPGFTMPE
ncbi:MAG: hypothetical protein SFY81_04965 [Verrucomicrobiota bacterium]|nr:hypothetical protein [Verrucomicrobiota bacterium]